MSAENKTRIYQLTEATTLSSDMNIPVDTETGGTKRIQLDTLIDDTLSKSGTAADAAVTGNEITGLNNQIVQKADISGTVDNAGQLLSDKGQTDTEPYLFRKSFSGDREFDCIVGGTVAWNQLVDSSTSVTRNGITATADASTSAVTFSGTATSDFSLNWNEKSIPSGHKVYFHGCPSGGGDAAYYGRNGYYAGSAYFDYGSGRIMEIQPNAARFIYQFVIKSGVTVNNLKVVPQCFDLTLLFGTTIADYIYSLEQSTAGAGVAYFRKLFPADYYAYDAGTLKSVEGVSAHETVGFNQWDEEWELGGIDVSTGANVTATDKIRSKNYIHVIPNTSYYFKTSNILGLRLYDSNKQYVDSTAQINAVYTIPDNVHYVRFIILSTTTYNNDVCINLSDPSRNGTYEPYKKYSYPLDSSLTLLGILKKDASNNLYFDGDEYAPDGTVTRKYGVVDLGTLTWIRSATGISGYYRFLGALPSAGKGVASSAVGVIICGKYNTISGNDVYQGTNGIAINAAGDSLVVYDSTYAQGTADTFKTSASGIYAVYELATATTETADPYQNPQIVDPYGTEAYETTGIVPVGHETFYPENLRKKIEGLPFNFATLIAPTETSYKATRAYSTGKLFIVDNILYKATTSIASGGTITPGTNCTATTLAEIIAALS